MFILFLFQWTVNGQLRVGFFTTKSVTAGTELTFDYQFQRYGYSFLFSYFPTPVFLWSVRLMHGRKHFTYKYMLCVVLVKVLVTGGFLVD